MYDPILFVKDKESKKIICCLCEIEVALLYCISQGLVLKQAEDIIHRSYADVKKWMGIMYGKSKLKYHTEAALVGWMTESKIYFRIMKLAEKNGIAQKVAQLKKAAA